MPGRSNAGEGKKTRESMGKVEGALDLGEVKEEGSSPFKIELIRELIFSYLTNKDLLSARLVTKEWTPMATEELRGRASNCPWIGEIREDFGEVREIIVLNNESVTSFIDLMTPTPIIPVQKVAIRLDLLSIEPSALLQLLTFIAPWIRAIRLHPLAPYDLNRDAPLLGERGRKAVAWTFALPNFTRLQFPCLETLEVGQSGNYRLHHQTLAMTMMMILKSLVQGAGNLNTLVYNIEFFEKGGAEEETEREITKGITLALPSSLKRLDFGGCSEYDYCAVVDYEALATVNLNLEEFLGMGKPESPQAFLRFLDGQKRSLRRTLLPRLEEIYRPDFPQLPLITKFTMDVHPTSTLECLKVFPALTSLRIDLEMGRGGFINGRGNQQARPMDLSRLLTHPSVKVLIVRGPSYVHGFRDDRIIQFDFLAHIFPNLIHVDFDCFNLSPLTKVFTHFPLLQSLHLRIGLYDIGGNEGLEAALSGIPPAICSHTKAYSIADDAGFNAISAIASRDPTSTVGLGNLKDLQVLTISDSSRYQFQYELILTNLNFHVVFKELPRLREIRLFGEIKKDCDLVLEALKERGIRVHMVPRQK